MASCHSLVMPNKPCPRWGPKLLAHLPLFSKGLRTPVCHKQSDESHFGLGADLGLVGAVYLVHLWLWLAGAWMLPQIGVLSYPSTPTNEEAGPVVQGPEVTVATATTRWAPNRMPPFDKFDILFMVQDLVVCCTKSLH